MSMLRNILRLSGSVKVCRSTFRVSQSLRYYAEDAAKPAAATQMSFSFGMPGQMFYNNADVKQVDVPSGTGTFGILAQHVPSLAVLKPGVISVHEHDGTISKYFASSGSVTVNADSSVQILAEMAVPVDHLDPAAVKEGLSKAQQELAAASTDLARAEAQIAIEAHEAMDQAIAGK
ncbi:ATP synthase subunit delta, mitochondrial-like [Acanthaster planci]|uniref:ATP synthase F(1) complex subunit delta, mitochondrial n=1 Tax=Acanthaster planci TaxID=133434 RepID=A0A8B7Z7R0_ACAPL|nr:ATP synthase subunit delta, mitochondrial-like [Acanthaster planci]